MAHKGQRQGKRRDDRFAKCRTTFTHVILGYLRKAVAKGVESKGSGLLKVSDTERLRAVRSEVGGM